MIEINRLEEIDLIAINKIRNEYLQYIRQYKHHNLQDQKEWFFNNKNDIYYSIKENNELKGALGLTQINYFNRSVELSLITINYISPPYAFELLKFGMDYTFNYLNMHKLYATVFEYDKRKQEFFKENNWKKEATLRDDVIWKGRYWEHYYYSILDHEYFYLYNNVSDGKYEGNKNEKER